MRCNLEKHGRHSIRLMGYDYSYGGAYFITICAHSQRCLFGEVKDSEMVSNEFGQIVQKYWHKLPELYPQAAFDMFVLMPNHIHGIVAIEVGAIHELPLQGRLQRRRMLIPKIVGRFKMNTAKRINLLRGMPGVQVWQRNYWEHIIRNEESLNRIREYMLSNPKRWLLDRQNPTRIGEDDFDRWLTGPFNALKA
jgi:REP element-mobilizing transposase RayT